MILEPGVTTSLLQRLRGETAPLHAAVEQRVRILDADAHAGTYRDYLAALLGFHRPLEARIRDAEGIDGFLCRFTPVWKTPVLASDLRALGVGDAAVAAMRDCRSVPAQRTPAFTLGCMYVLEGATLGGRVIHHQLSRRMPDTMARASSYLRVYGDATVASWRAFTAALEDHAAGEPQQAEAVAGATATFASLLTWLDA